MVCFARRQAVDGDRARAGFQPHILERSKLQSGLQSVVLRGTGALARETPSVVNAVLLDRRSHTVEQNQNTKNNCGYPAYSRIAKQNQPNPNLSAQPEDFDR
jgi:hypothetical protein